jgi:hypothetical protein
VCYEPVQIKCAKNKVSFYEKQQFTKVNAQAISIMNSAQHLRNDDLGQSGIKRRSRRLIFTLLSSISQVFKFSHWNAILEGTNFVLQCSQKLCKHVFNQALCIDSKKCMSLLQKKIALN